MGNLLARLFTPHNSSQSSETAMPISMSSDMSNTTRNTSDDMTQLLLFGVDIIKFATNASKSVLITIIYRHIIAQNAAILNQGDLILEQHYLDNRTSLMILDFP